MLVGLGAALFVLVPLAIGGPDQGSDVSRAIQGVATGVGFLGAGEILHYSRHPDGVKVKGLTSAASIWVTAALGIAAAYGMWQLGLLGALLTLLVLVGAKWLEQRLTLHQEDE
jgi:putative Mg2+ transporter-C (MgtC) family protein